MDLLDGTDPRDVFGAMTVIASASLDATLRPADVDELLAKIGTQVALCRSA